MMSIPNEVARNIILDRIHPVTAWRNYYRLSKRKLASLLNLSEMEIEQMEKSNRHLQEESLRALCKVFHIYPDALRFRYIHLPNN